MVDQRGRDMPPNFHLSTQVGAYKYHALLCEKVEIERKLIFDLSDEGALKRKAEGTTSQWLDAGVYGFPRIEDRDKFCRRCNAAADAEEHLACFAVTIPNVHLFVVEERETADPKTTTGPVVEDDNLELDEDFDPDHPAL